MKKTIFVLLVLLVCAIQTSKAYEYFTIYFNDGTRSEAFYATDVDSICYSKLSLDGIEYPDWQVQEIYTCDSVYRYPLAQIDSLSFKDVDEEIVGEDIKRVHETVLPIYAECSSTSEITTFLPKIKDTEGVEDAWVDNQTLFVKIRDWETIFFLYPSKQDDNVGRVRSLSRTVALNNKILTRQISNNDEDLNNICIVDLFAKNENNKEETEAIDTLIYLYNSCGINVKLYREPTQDMPELKPAMPSFYKNEIFNYDMVFLNTHGLYNEKTGVHWLASGEVLMCTAKTKDSISLNTIKTELDSIWAERRLNYKHGNSRGGIGYSWATEKRNGQWMMVCYTTVSQNYISSSQNSFKKKGKAIVFNAACQSLKGNKQTENGLAEIFIKKGAGCYLGYDETNRVGGFGGTDLFGYLAFREKTVGYSFKQLPNWEKEDVDNENGTTAILKIYPPGTGAEKLRLSYPQTLPVNDETNDNKIKVTLQSCVRIFDPFSDFSKNNRYGFVLSKNSDFTELIPLKSDNYIMNYEENLSNLYVYYELSNNEIQPNTTYYYCACMNDGFSDCYGEIKSFTTKGDENGEVEAYIVRDGDTLIFYYDNKRKVRNNVLSNVLDWGEYNRGHYYRYITSSYEAILDKITKVVSFDPSFQNYTPSSTAYWFCLLANLVEIKNLNYLNTSKVTDMQCMFASCHSLTSLDLSSFNTADVTNMSSMFSNCLSLTSLDLSSFNTANVTDMSLMFSRCSSLTSLDLSKFNTANVTDMRTMFFSCSSLTSLDLSKFNTANVTNMYYMFSSCSSLTSLDLSNFNTSNVTDMAGMFRGNKELRTIYGNNWNVRNFINDVGMFDECDKLVGGKGTKWGENLYGYDDLGRPLYYYCYGVKAAHIDGGKDNPGLFTAK